MQRFRLLFLVLTVALTALCLSACGFDLGSLMPGGTTAVTTAEAPATTTAVTTTAVTTAPITTTAAPQLSENPIKSASLTSDGTKLIVKYENNVSQNLVTEISARPSSG